MALENRVVQRKSPKLSLRAFLLNGLLGQLMTQRSGQRADRRIGHGCSRSIGSIGRAAGEGASACQLNVRIQVGHHVGGGGGVIV